LDWKNNFLLRIKISYNEEKKFHTFGKEASSESSSGASKGGRKKEERRFN
jgi:hypothetical protein